MSNDTPPPGFPGGYVPIVGEIVEDGVVRPYGRNGPPPGLKIIPDDQAVPARADTLRMGEAWAKLEKS